MNIETTDRSNNCKSLEMQEDAILSIIELRHEYSNTHSTDESWMKISDELNIPIDLCRLNFSKAISQYKSQQEGVDSKIFQLIKRLETNLVFNYCLENFSEVCRFCLKIREDDKVSTILDDSTEELLIQSNELIERIHFTLYDNILEKVDFKLSNLICIDCDSKIKDFYKFKKKCDLNAEVLMQVKNELDRMLTHADPSMEELIKESSVCEEMENEDDETTQESNDSLEEDDEMEPSDSNEATHKSNEGKSNEKRKRDRKSYKGKNSQCPICGKLVKGIQMHMLIHSGERRHKCSYCFKSFTQSGQLKRHINSHLNIRNYKCPEPGCDRTFVDPSSVTKHLVVHNKEDRKFQCSLCGSRFNRLGALRYHEKTHRQERNHSCDICKKSFLAKYDLTKHIRTHTGEKPYSCKFCDKKFSISKNAKVHLRVHTKEKPYSCNVCDLTFAYRSSMKNHLMKIHNQADVSSLPLMQAVNNTTRLDSDQNDPETQQTVDSDDRQT